MCWPPLHLFASQDEELAKDVEAGKILDQSISEAQTALALLSNFRFMVANAPKNWRVTPLSEKMIK